MPAWRSLPNSPPDSNQTASEVPGAVQRRDWPDERKIAIVAESLEAGVNASALARAHDINPQQLFGWRRRFRAEAEALIASSRRDPEPIVFAPVQVDAPAPGLPASPTCSRL